MRAIYPKVAVLLATYNGEQYIEDQIISILNQIDVELDIYVRDDGSTDNSNNILSQYKLPNIKIFNSKEKSSGPANNFLSLIEVVSAEDYDFVSFADQDDLWFNDKLINGIKSMRDNFSDAYSSNVIAFWDNGKQLLVDKADPQKMYDFVFESSGPGCTFILSKVLYSDLRQFLTSHHSIKSKIWMHDWFIYAFARGNGYYWFIDKKPYMFYRQHNSNVVGANFGLFSIYRRLRLISNGLYKSQCKLIINSFVKNYPLSFPSDNMIFLNRVKFLFQVKNCRRKFFDRVVLGALVFFCFF
jgi:rhamnosyltransferase